jgi:hypothetical protein
MAAEEKILQCVLTFLNSEGAKLEQSTSRIPLSFPEHNILSHFISHLRSFVGLREMYTKVGGLGDYGLKLQRYNRDSKRNFMITTQAQFCVDFTEKAKKLLNSEK